MKRNDKEKKRLTERKNIRDRVSQSENEDIKT